MIPKSIHTLGSKDVSENQKTCKLGARNFRRILAVKEREALTLLGGFVEDSEETSDLSFDGTGMVYDRVACGAWTVLPLEPRGNFRLEMLASQVASWLPVASSEPTSSRPT
jgi:hypothetical protein